MESDTLFWQARIEITQVPQPFEPKEAEDIPGFDNEGELKVRSFLLDPIGSIPFKSYGLELIASENIKWEFFTEASSKTEALVFGHTWLNNLKYEFIGLDGKVHANLITMETLQENEDYEIEEIIIPDGILSYKIDIVERFISSFFFPRRNEVRLYAIWQKLTERSDYLYTGHPKFSFRFFIRYKARNLNENDVVNLKGLLQYLCTAIENQNRIRANLLTPSDIDYSDILRGTVFKNEHENYKWLDRTKIDFDFPENTPLLKLPILKDEIVRYADINEDFKKNSLSIGFHVKNGIVSDHITYVPINKLTQNMVIFGKSGTGKTYLLAQLIEELNQKADSIGVLVLNVAKESQNIYYNNFLHISFSDKDFNIPYFVKGESAQLDKHLQELATYLCASLGLKNVFEKIFYSSAKAIMTTQGKMPSYFLTILKSVESYIRKNPYGKDLQGNFLQALKNRINVFNDKKIQQTLSITSELPTWIKNWINGQNIFLDLSMCNKFVKLLIVNAILQLIRVLTKDREIEKLNQVVVIDEAHEILEKPITSNPDDTDFIMKEQMAKIFSKMLKEYRSRGVGFIIADQSPSQLFEDVPSQPSVKIIFREDYPNNSLFTEDPEERQLITQLENRFALVNNGATGEKYIIKTIDYRQFG